MSSMRLLFSLAVTGALAQMFSPTLLPLKVYASGCEAGEYVVLAYKAGTSRDAPSSTDDAKSTGKERSTRSRFWGMTTFYSIAAAGLGLLLVVLAVVIRRRHVRKQRRTQADCKVHVSPRPQPQRGQASRVSTSTARTKRPSVSESWRLPSAPADVIVPVGGLRQQSVVSMANPSGRCSASESVGFKFCSWP
jgi:hypothetical protein